MAFRVSNTLVESYRYISKHDEAVDRDDPDFEETWSRYMDGKCEPPLRASGQATVWHFRHLTPRQRAKVMAMSAQEGALCALVMALQKVDNFFDEKGRPIKVEHVFEDGIRVASEKTLQQIHDAGGNELLYDLVQRVSKAVFPDPKS